MFPMVCPRQYCAPGLLHSLSDGVLKWLDMFFIKILKHKFEGLRNITNPSCSSHKTSDLVSSGMGCSQRNIHCSFSDDIECAILIQGTLSDRQRRGMRWEGRLPQAPDHKRSQLPGTGACSHSQKYCQWVWLTALLALLSCGAEAAGSQAQVLRAGSGLRQNEVQAHHLTRKAVCSGHFLGQAPLFKGEWVPDEVSQVSWPCKFLVSLRTTHHCRNEENVCSDAHMLAGSCLSWRLQAAK